MTKILLSRFQYYTTEELIELAVVYDYAAYRYRCNAILEELSDPLYLRHLETMQEICSVLDEKAKENAA